MSAPLHRPVLMAEVVEALAPAAGKVYVDGTFGAGGYAQALLAAAACRVFGIDRDPAAIAAGRAVEEAFAGRLKLLAGRFGEMEQLLAGEGVDAVDGVTLDIGVSSMQLDRPERGFSFAADGPLDMRMEQSGPDAAELVNEASEAELADIIYRYGEERRARAVARAIVAARAKQPIRRTGELAAIIARVVRGAPGQHPATRTFQALRIRVNDELGELERGLAAAERLLRPTGRLAVVAFHSLEDRIVKRFLARRSGRRPAPSRHLPAAPGAERAPSFRLLFGGVRTPGAAEIAANPRARSARLRAAERTAAPAWPAELPGELAA
jgi:16S rRNA (cytosine1402-N4)-methyltransferase